MDTILSAVAPSAMLPAAVRLIRAVLTYPVSMRVKRLVRSAAWFVKGAGLRNPPMPASVERVLFVCLGNICRSPFAALLAERLMAEAGRADIVCASAGIRPSQAGQSPAAACTVAATYGLALEGHVPQLLTQESIAAHDVIFVMEATQFQHVRATHPDFRDRIFLLSLYDDAASDAFERCNIVDPFGQPIAAFESCYRRVERALRRWLATVSNHRPSESSRTLPRGHRS